MGGRKPKRGAKNRTAPESPFWLSYVDLSTNIAAVLILLFGLAIIGGATGFRLLDGWTLVAVIALLGAVTVAAMLLVAWRNKREGPPNGRVSTWRPWGDHPIVVTIMIVGTIASLAVALVQSPIWPTRPPGAPTTSAASDQGTSFQVTMRLSVSGRFRIALVNTGKIASGAGYLEVASWADGSPGEDMRVRETFTNLIPNADWSYDADFFEARRRHGWTSGDRNAISGYIAVSCDRCTKPQGWAFHIPGESEPWPPEWSGSMPMMAFSYPAKRPGIGESVVVERYESRER